MTQKYDHEPFAQSWLGIAMQLFVVAVLAVLTVYLWAHR